MAQYFSAAATEFVPGGFSDVGAGMEQQPYPAPYLAPPPPPDFLVLSPPSHALAEGPGFRYAPCPAAPHMGFYLGPSVRSLRTGEPLPLYYERVTSLGLPLPPVLLNLAQPPDELARAVASADRMLEEGFKAGAWGKVVVLRVPAQ